MCGVKGNYYPANNQNTYPELRQSEPENEQGLEEVVEGEPVDEHIREEFDNLDETEDGPVGQPIWKMNKREVNRTAPIKIMRYE